MKLTELWAPEKLNKTPPLDPTSEKYNWLNAKKAAAILCISPATLCRWRKENYGPPWIRLGSRSIRYLETELIGWLEDQRHEQ